MPGTPDAGSRVLLEPRWALAGPGGGGGQEEEEEGECFLLGGFGATFVLDSASLPPPPRHALN